MKQFLKRIPILGPLSHHLVRYIKTPSKSFPGSRAYWMERYQSGGKSGDGSYNELAEFKAKTINQFIREKNIRSVIEYGCGDGNQLRLAEYPSYLGFDICPQAISICQGIFSGDGTKAFKLMEEYAGERAEMTLSLDVIQHLVEDTVFATYMDRLFDSAERFVVAYSSNTDKNPRGQFPHVRHRNFTRWITEMKPDWTLIRHIPNEHPYRWYKRVGSFSDFYIYERV